jgi:nitrite reductase (NADH) small subunit/3-phenylpropionate/trans-cinnamate dioxygenase ferredoxin subunit
MFKRVKAATLSQLPPGVGLAVEVEGRRLALFRIDGQIHAIDDLCPHAGGPLSAGHVVDGVVMCPWHGWRFRLADGVWADAPKSGLNVRCYRAVQEGEDVWIEVDW